MACARGGLTRTLGFAALLSLAACAGAPRAPTAAAVRTSPAWHEAVFPGAPGWLVPVERGAGGDAATLWLLGGLRAEQRADRLEFADDLLAEPLIKSCRSDGGFLHISQGSRVYWSRTFLGQLEPAGLAEEHAAFRVAQCGPVTMAFGSRGGGYQILSRAGTRQLPPELKWVHFSSEAEGHALATPDQLFETRDGGRSFSAITARPAPDRDRPNIWLGVESFEQQADSVRDSELDALSRAWARRAVASEAGAMVEGLRLADGTWVRSAAAGYGHQYLAFRSPDGRISERHLLGCSMFPWGVKLLAHCPGSEPALRVLDAQHEQALPNPPFPPLTIAVDPAGGAIVSRPLTTDNRYPVRPEPLMIFDGQSWSTHQLNVEPLAIRGPWLLVRNLSNAHYQLLRLDHLEHAPRDLAGAEFDQRGALSLLPIGFSTSAAMPESMPPVPMPSSLSSISQQPKPGRSRRAR